ncbi:hypothetical protein V6N11_072710 [Hibiscus sabdariffa]|uniref:Transmembrane 9 superfamily member n=1 Tax=Hibiscus sabdariffa TaxID=183260 RepID=A0ABR1ZBE9_9ROSI
MSLVCLWFGTSVPLVFVGSYLGFKRPAIEDQQNSRADTRAGMVYDGSILPFEAVFIELSFILTLIWLNQLCYATSSCAVKTIIGGTIAFYACFWFVWKIFSSVKTD